MSTQRAYGLQYIRKFPRLAKFLVYYEGYEGKDATISEEALAEFIAFCEQSSSVLSKKECILCKNASLKKEKVEIAEFWHTCICVASDVGIEDAIETNESGVRSWRKIQQN
jgi:hypothetical protein